MITVLTYFPLQLMGWVGLQQTKIFLMNVLTYRKLNSKSILVSIAHMVNYYKLPNWFQKGLTI
jgi:hypothetical protein